MAGPPLMRTTGALEDGGGGRTAPAVSLSIIMAVTVAMLMLSYRTGAALQPATTAVPMFFALPSSWPSPSSSGYES